jgi:hypothetical protein
MLVFHKNLPIEFGPAVSLYVKNIEFLKFDCFGNGGHYYIMNGKNNDRIWFDEKTVEDQILKASEQLLNNIPTFLSTSNK